MRKKSHLKLGGNFDVWYLRHLVNKLQQWREFNFITDAYNPDPINPTPEHTQRISKLSVDLNAGTNISAFANRGGDPLSADAFECVE